jgi:amidase
VHAALDAMQAHGAELVDVLIPSLDRLLQGSGVIPHEFKFVLADYLAGHPDAPVGSLGDIIAHGLHHEQLDHAFRLRDAPASRDTEAYRDALALRRALREAVLAVFEAQGLDVLAHPTLQREAAPIGDSQAGPTCQLSASTGLPAISFPAGFTASGVPVGIEFLGRPFSEAMLLACAYDWEQTAKLRRAPFSTPALVDGRAPLARHARVRLPAADGAEDLASVSFAYEAHTALLDVRVELGELAEGDLIALTIQRGLPDQPGPVIEHLRRAGWPSAPSRLKLRAQDREALQRGELYVHLYTRQSPLGAGRVAIAL